MIRLRGLRCSDVMPRFSLGDETLKSSDRAVRSVIGAVGLYAVAYCLTYLVNITFRYHITSGAQHLILIKEAIGESIAPWLIPAVIVLLSIWIDRWRGVTRTTAVLFGLFFALSSVSVFDKEAVGKAVWYGALCAFWIVGGVAAYGSLKFGTLGQRSPAVPR